MKPNYYLILLLIPLFSCASRIPRKSFLVNDTTRADYSNLDLWAAHAQKKDMADERPEGDNVFGEKRKADVFFIHPTTYIDKRGNDQWNAGFQDQKTNKKTDDGTIRYQASAFNEVGYVYAPRYRQAHLHAYYSKDTASARQALDFAYRDVKAAFQYYLDHYNNGRPIILASHSQGTTHAIRLIRDYFDGKPLGDQLVAAYMIGMAVHEDQFENLFPCENADQIHCYCSWRTFRKGFIPEWKEAITVVTNPLSWRRSMDYMAASLNPGTILKDFNDIYYNLVDAQISGNILWATKPKFPGSFFLRTPNYHVADINFYYISIRANALNRLNHFLKNH